MSLTRNVIANYAGQIYVALIGIALVPLYVKYMGIEAFGLVGFFAMLQAWFMLLDMGLTPTMSRETARFGGGSTDALTLRRLLRALEGVFVAVAAIGMVALVVGSDRIAADWLKVQDLPLAEVQRAVILMAIIVGLRWICGLYRGAIIGFERLVWLNVFNAGIATVRFGLVVPFLMFVGSTPTHYFGFQLVVAVFELGMLVHMAYRLMPAVDGTARLPWDWRPLRGILKFSLTIAFTSAVWVLVTQTDKLLLSGIVALEEYAHFTLAVLVASGIMMISSPISGALLPRMTRLNAQGDEPALIGLYRRATQLVAVVAIPAAVTLALFAEPVLWAWTGDRELARIAAPVLALYALGNGFLALAAFPYYLQFAKGDLRLHLIGNFFFLLLFIPLLLWMTRTHGMLGAGYAWIIANATPFVLWLPVVHRRFSRGLHSLWLWRDIGPIAFASAVAAACASSLIQWPTGRLAVVASLAGVGACVLLSAMAGSSWLRGLLVARWHARVSQ
ncbi:MAG: oligosaccharide flippase family protein [Pseudomonadales bacterium]|nr:oligosaccharide flippase family protein [Pseudomonadales bacterium]